jgi:hypothetical protein
MRARQFIPKTPILEQQLDEINMSPGALKQFAQTHPLAQQITAGFELELCFTDIGRPQGYGGIEDERINRYWDLETIQDLFSEYTSRRDRGYSRMEEDYQTAYFEKVADNVDPDEVERLARAKARDDIDSDTVDERVQAVLADNPDADEDEVRKQVIEEIVDANWSDHEYEAHEEAEEDVRNELDYDFGEWLWANHNYLSDVAAEYDLGVPFEDEDSYDDTPYDTDQMEDAARRLRQYTDMRVRVSSSYHSVQRLPGLIIIEPDGSIEPDDSDEAAAEIITPPLPLAETLELFAKVRDWAEEYGGYTNSSTGLHFNISSPDMSQFDYVKMVLLLGDQHLLGLFDREYNSYCKSAIGKIISEMRRQHYQGEGQMDRVLAERVMEVLKSHTYRLAQEFIQDAIKSWGNTFTTDKYTSLNWKGDYMEVRALGGPKIMTDPQLTLNAIYRVIRVWASAVDPKLDREEYLKKLYAMTQRGVENTQVGNKISVSQIISRYMTGDRSNLDLLVAELRKQIAQSAQQRDLAKVRGQHKPLLPEPNPQMNLDLRDRPGPVANQET